MVMRNALTDIGVAILILHYNLASCHTEVELAGLEYRPLDLGGMDVPTVVSELVSRFLEQRPDLFAATGVPATSGCAVHGAIYAMERQKSSDGPVTGMVRREYFLALSDVTGDFLKSGLIDLLPTYEAQKGTDVDQWVVRTTRPLFPR